MTAAGSAGTGSSAGAGTGGTANGAGGSAGGAGGSAGGAGGRTGGRAVPYDRLKRAIDVLLVLLGMALLAPLFAVLAWRVRRELGSPVLFRQVRPGRDGELLELRKFRTMTDERGPDGQLLPDEQRLTDFDRRLRSTSLDVLYVDHGAVPGGRGVPRRAPEPPAPRPAGHAWVAWRSPPAGGVTAPPPCAPPCSARHTGP